jgi:hypothetical protein
MQESEGVFREGAKMQLRVTFCGEALTVSVVWAGTVSQLSLVVEPGAGVHNHLVSSINTRRCPGDARPLPAVGAVRHYHSQTHLARHPYLAATCHRSFAVATSSHNTRPAPIATANRTSAHKSLHCPLSRARS